jgi:hypothetical protein
MPRGLIAGLIAAAADAAGAQAFQASAATLEIWHIHHHQHPF